MKIINRLIVLAFIFALAGCSTTVVDPAQYDIGKSADTILALGEQSLKNKDYKVAVQHFEALDARYPFGKDAERAQLYVIYAYFKSGDFASALAAADRYIHVYPANKDVAYAYYMKGLATVSENFNFLERYFPVDMAQRDLAPYKQAFVAFSQVVHRFPKSKYASDSLQRMIDIRDTLARHALQVGQFYYGYGAFVAAANRANDIVQHYQGSSSVPQALVLMVKSYRKLGLARPEEQAMKVLRMNYPKLAKKLG